MTQMVYDAFRKQRELNLMLGLQSNVEIGGRSGFIFNTKHGRPIMPPISGCIRLGENNVNPKVMQYVMGCWMSGGHPFSTDRSGAKTIQMHRSQ